MHLTHRFKGSANAERLLKELTTQQHLHPRSSLGRKLSDVCKAEGIPQFIAQEAIAQLGLDEHRAMGRLSRAQVMNLATKIDLGRAEDEAEKLHLVNAA